MPCRGKHTSLLLQGINYDRKSFTVQVPENKKGVRVRKKKILAFSLTHPSIFAKQFFTLKMHKNNLLGLHSQHFILFLSYKGVK
jgi:hypothetical protein